MRNTRNPKNDLRVEQDKLMFSDIDQEKITIIILILINKTATFRSIYKQMNEVASRKYVYRNIGGRPTNGTRDVTCHFSGHN